MTDTMYGHLHIFVASCFYHNLYLMRKRYAKQQYQKRLCSAIVCVICTLPFLSFAVVCMRYRNMYCISLCVKIFTFLKKHEY